MRTTKDGTAPGTQVAEGRRTKIHGGCRIGTIVHVARTTNIKAIADGATLEIDDNTQIDAHQEEITSIIKPIKGSIALDLLRNEGRKFLQSQLHLSLTGVPKHPSLLSRKPIPIQMTHGKLAAETNTVSGTNIVLKYNEPPESRKPPASQAWRLYVFKGKETLDTIELASRSCWLFGRERAVVDYTIEHPSCSKQHAVLQFRYVEKMDEFGDRTSGVKPYLIDLESANGTKVNGERMPDRRYIEIISGDVLGFGDSTREYVLMLPPGG
ncbi:hypothetical protein MMC09_002432 [Bachmanniomyces sp. S44760]|nr:hypothetical protein [Bachmanniomyces sp. S44760]